MTLTSPIINPDGNDHFPANRNTESVLFSLTPVFVATDTVFRIFYTESALYDYNKSDYTLNLDHFSRNCLKYAFARAVRKMYVVAEYDSPDNDGFAYADDVLLSTSRSGDCDIINLLLSAFAEEQGESLSQIRMAAEVLFKDA